MSSLQFQCLSIWNWMWRRGFHLATAKRWLFLVSFVTIIFIVYYCSYKTQLRPQIFVRPRPLANYVCPNLLSDPSALSSSYSGGRGGSGGGRKWMDHSAPATRARIDPKVLLFVETTFSRVGRDIAELLVHNRMKYKVEVSGRSLPIMTNGEKGRFGVIVFENYTKYLHMDKWNKELLDKYCKEFNVGIVGFMPSRDETFVGAQLKNASLFIDTNIKLKDAYLNPSSSVLRLTRAGDIVRGILPNDPSDLWTVFSPNHTTYDAVALATPYHENQDEHLNSPLSTSNLPLISVIQDKGEADGIRRVLFGGGLKFWLNRLLFLDAVSYVLEPGSTQCELEALHSNRH